MTRPRSGQGMDGGARPNAAQNAERVRRIVDVLMTLQPGEVATYGEIAEIAGYPKQSRLVGRILSTTDVEVPWWRVVNAAGRLVPGHERAQSALLREEDVMIRNGKVATAPFGRFSRSHHP
ncbi:MAG: MGMT family protein [Ilumatobacteraceae bacterium]